MFKMEKMTIVQQTEKVLAKVDVTAYDNRTGKEESLVLYAELTSEDQDAVIVAKRALKELGYLYLGISNVETTSIPFDAEGFFLAGKDKEAEDLARI